MLSRRLLLFSALGSSVVLASEGVKSVRGRLTKSQSLDSKTSEPALKTADGTLIRLTGDKDTLGVLNDERMAGVDLEVEGLFKSSGLFEVGPIYTKSMHVYKDGKRLSISYWCSVCSIRTYTPGKCWCCQAETDLDLRESE
jgi:hypothetical protein